MRKKSEQSIKADCFVGKRIYDLRCKQYLSRQTLSAAIGVSHVQLRKYEAGVDSVSLMKLVLIAHSLGTNLEFLLQGLDKHLGYGTSDIEEIECA